MCELTNLVGEAAPVVGNSIHALWNRIGEVSSFDERVAIAEEFLLIPACTDTAWTIAMAAAEYVLRRHGATGIREVVGHFSTGLRQFERNFQREVGTAPKTFARIARFQSALDAKVAAPNRTWLDIAHSFGYHDQMHMIHDFQALGRNTPTHLIAQLGDSRAPAGMSKAA
jgi:AraC-like DNA-binding protein